MKDMFPFDGYTSESDFMGDDECDFFPGPNSSAICCLQVRFSTLQVPFQVHFECKEEELQ